MSLLLTTPPVGSLDLCPPRFGTPRDLTRATFGGNVAEIARRLGKPLMPWQQLVADVAFEQDPDGALVYDLVVVVVPRQSGKTTLVMSKTLNRMILMAQTHGPQRSTYVAQKRLDARKKFERDFAPALRHPRAKRSFPEVDHPRMRPTGDTQWRLSLNNGSEAFEFGTQSWWQVGVPDDSGGHGDTLDDGTIDEARFLETGEVEEGLSPSDITRTDTQLWVVSTAGTGGSLGTANSAYLWRKVLAGRKACETGRHGKTAYFEWSASESADSIESWGDPEVWWACMPALGHTIPVEKIHSKWEKAQEGGQEGIDAFRRAYLNQWPEIPTLTGDESGQGWDATLWPPLADPGAERGSPVAFGVAVAPDRSWSAVAVAWQRPDGREQVMLAEYASTTSWVGGRVGQLIARWGGVVVAGDDAADLFDGSVRLSGSDQRRAHHALADAVTAGLLRHGNEPALNTAVRAARWRKQGDSRVLDRSGLVDISPLHAAALAILGLREHSSTGGWMVGVT